jgi:outer membrane protein
MQVKRVTRSAQAEAVLERANGLPMHVNLSATHPVAMCLAASVLIATMAWGPALASAQAAPAVRGSQAPQQPAGAGLGPGLGPGLGLGPGPAQIGATNAGAATQMDVPPIPDISAPSPQPTQQPIAEAGAVGAPWQTPRLAVSGLTPNFLGFLGPYRRPHIPELFPGNGARLAPLVRSDKLYLTLHDALALALENNLDIEVERDDLTLAATDEVRARGGGAIRGIDYSLAEPPAGVGGPGSPLLNSTAVNANPTTPAVTDLTALNSTTQTTQSLSELGTAQTYSAGPNVPLFDPQFILTGGYLRRSDTVTLTTTTGDTGTTGSGTSASGSGTTQTPPLHFIAANAAYLQGFSTGLQLTAIANNDSQVIYGSNSGNNPFSRPSTSVTLTQPLLRGRGRDVNLRYLHIAQTNRRISKLLFEQQVLDTVYGISRIYYDLVSLGENVQVKQEALRTAEKLRSDDADQVIEGTLAPVELTRAAALVSSSEFDLVQAQGLYRQQEVILRNQIVRTESPVFTVAFTEIVPTDHIAVPEVLDLPDTTALIAGGLARRPDLAQAELQQKTGQISVNASRNYALPQVNVYANAETRGASEQSYDTLGTPPATAQLTVPTSLALGGLRTSTIYQAGVQVTLPLRNRVAQADAARDAVQLRQVQARTEKLGAQIRQEIENAVIALQTAQAAYKAAVTSRGYQQQLLETTQDQLTVGQGTQLQVIQAETYLAQARSTEIAARSDWMKARIALDHAMGTLLEKNNIALDDVIDGAVR